MPTKIFAVCLAVSFAVTGVFLAEEEIKQRAKEREFLQASIETDTVGSIEDEVSDSLNDAENIEGSENKIADDTNVSENISSVNQVCVEPKTYPGEKDDSLDGETEADPDRQEDDPAGIPQETAEDETSEGIETNFDPALEDPDPSEEKPETLPSGEVSDPESPSSESVSDFQPETSAEGDKSEEPADQPAHNPIEYRNVDRTYFSDALFVGDSRMIGIKEYGGLTEPTYYADTGMSIFSLHSKELSVSGIGSKVKFSDLIKNHKFGKIYIMLGINEAGSLTGEIASKYEKTVLEIMENQPDAVLFLCANLHVTKKKSDKDRIFNNAHIDDINASFKDIADRYGLCYIDVNEIYDDAEGNLDSQYASDFAHMYGKYYSMWIDWLCTKGVYRDLSPDELRIYDME